MKTKFLIKGFIDHQFLNCTGKIVKLLWIEHFTNEITILLRTKFPITSVVQLRKANYLFILRVGKGSHQTIQHSLLHS